jgi:hypothetical protein
VDHNIQADSPGINTYNLPGTTFTLNNGRLQSTAHLAPMPAQRGGCHTRSVQGRWAQGPCCTRCGACRCACRRQGQAVRHPERRQLNDQADNSMANCNLTPANPTGRLAGRCWQAVITGGVRCVRRAPRPHTALPRGRARWTAQGTGPAGVKDCGAVYEAGTH